MSERYKARNSEGEVADNDKKSSGDGSQTRHAAATPGWADWLTLRLRGLVIVIGALTAIVVAILALWEPARVLICDKAGLCASSCEPDDMECGARG